MAKTIILIRHAKSSWKDESLDDHDRPLNKRGQRDAPVMAQQLQKQNIKPDKIFSSTALRAKTTAQYFADTLGVEMVLQKGLYLADRSELISFINERLKIYNTIALVGHNPDLTELCNYVTGTMIDNIPTAAFALLQIQEDVISKNNCKLITFCYPKQFFSS